MPQSAQRLTLSIDSRSIKLLNSYIAKMKIQMSDKTAHYFPESTEVYASHRIASQAHCRVRVATSQCAIDWLVLICVPCCGCNRYTTSEQ
jgi:hypothetical protein